MIYGFLYLLAAFHNPFIFQILKKNLILNQASHFGLLYSSAMLLNDSVCDQFKLKQQDFVNLICNPFRSEHLENVV